MLAVFSLIGGVDEIRIVDGIGDIVAALPYDARACWRDVHEHAGREHGLHVLPMSLTQETKIWLAAAIAVVLASMLGFCTPSYGHDWYPASCCAGKHCHPVPCDTISRGQLGRYDGYWWQPQEQRYFFLKSLHSYSPDGDCHVCVMTPFGSVVPRCIFTPAPEVF